MSNNDIFTIGDDLYIDPISGDFDIAVCDEISVRDNLIAFPGWWKQNPQDGVGIFAYQNSSGQQQVLARNVKQQLTADGYQCNNPVIAQTPNGVLTIQPNAIKP